MRVGLVDYCGSVSLRPHPPHPLDLLLRELPEEASAEERLAVVWRYYEQETGQHLDNPPTEVQRRHVHDWLTSSVPGGPTFVTYGMQRRLMAARSVKDKASAVNQLLCPACRPVRGMHTFPIAVDPWSAQSDPEHNARIKSLLNKELSDRGTFDQPLAEPLCVGIVAVVPRLRRVMDADNLVKGLLDSLTEVVYENDRHIQCLTSRRMIWSGEVGTGYYLVRITPVEPFEQDVIWDDPNPRSILIGQRVS